jgi:hypothetical protein
MYGYVNKEYTNLTKEQCRCYSGDKANEGRDEAGQGVRILMKEFDMAEN